MRVLVVEDFPPDAELMLREIRKLDIPVVHEEVDTKDAFVSALDRFNPDIILSDYSMPRFDGITALRLSRTLNPEVPFIMVTGRQNEEIAVKCMKEGAEDYVIKDDLRRLGPAVLAALDKYRLKYEKEKADEELKESYQRYRTLYSTMSQGVYEFDASGRLVSSNPAASEILGIDLDKLKGRSVEEIIAMIPDFSIEGIDIPEKPGTLTRNILLTGKAVRVPLVKIFNPHKKERRWLSGHSLPWIEPGKENPSGVFTIFSDITEQKNAQDALRKANEELELNVLERTKDLRETTVRLEEQKEILQNVIDNIPVMLVFYDPSGKIRMVNREFELITGWSQAETQKMDYMAAMVPEENIRREVLDYIRKADPGWKDFDLFTRSGVMLTSSWANVRLSDGSLIGIGIDMTARKKMEDDLQKLVTAIERLEEGIILFSTGGIIEYVNPSFESMSGYGVDEVIGYPVDVLKDYLMEEDFHGMFRRAEAEGKFYSLQKRRRRNGEIFDLSLCISAVYDKAGRIINYVAVGRDISQEVRMQLQLQQAHKMEALGTLAGGIAHDLKNTFTPILLNAEFLMGDIDADDPDYAIFEEMIQATRHGVELVNQILTFSRRTVQGKDQISVSRIIRDAVSLLRSTLPTTIDIETSLDADDAVILANPTQIKQIMMNLGSNAGHAMRGKAGKLTVALANVELADNDNAKEISPDLSPGPYVRITMQDTGIGMDEKTIERVFDPFFTTKVTGEGTGMGLAVVHGIVKDHHGAVAVRSAPGKGTTFEVFLPRLQKDPD